MEAGFAFDLACRLNERIAAIGVVARTMYIESYESCNVTHPTAVMTILGTARLHFQLRRNHLRRHAVLCLSR